MTSRAATPTIKGYYYQFDSSIHQLLLLASDTDNIVIEGIEDIDVNTATSTTAIQCKYLSKPKFINSAVREPISLMLGHFVKNSSAGLQYYLYAHFDDEVGGVEKTVDLNLLKDILSYKEKGKKKSFHLENGIDDKQLSSFLLQFKLIFGREFAVQQKEVIGLLRNHFGCGDFEADSLYYNNALRVVMDKAKDPILKNRKLTKGDLLKSINVKQRLYNEWYIKQVSKDDYLLMTKKNLKSTNAILPSRKKNIFIGREILVSKNPEVTLLNLVSDLTGKVYHPGKSYKDAAPPCFILDLDESEINKLKRDLISVGLRFNDGGESIGFSPALFNEGPVINLNNSQNKIARSSYRLRIITKKTFVLNQEFLISPDVILYYAKEPMSLKHPDTAQIFDIKYCETLKDILQTLN